MTTRSELSTRFEQIRQCTEWLCEPLEIEDYVVQPIVDVSPPKWHLGHTTWFFEAFILSKYDINYKPFHPLYNFIFNSYYEHIGERVERPNRGFMTRPTVKEIMTYRFAVNESMCNLINTFDETQWNTFSYLVTLGLQHEQQHQELLVTDIKYILCQNPLYPVYREKKASQTNQPTSKPDYLPFKGDLYEIGFNAEGFSYDNEGPTHQTFVQDFLLQNRLVTNREYLDFIEDRGYQDFRHWLSEGWDTVQREGWIAPLYWKNIDSEWHEATLSGLRKISLDAPVCHISFYEAEAFASWSKKRLPTEAEWEVAARRSNPVNKDGNFLEKEYFHPIPNKSDKQNKISQLLGDVWEWTQSSYLPYPGYRHTDDALGEYNGKFMANQMVLRGGSCATPESHIRITYRNFFHPDKRWQFTGIRLADNP